jgi:MFS transporter, MHS family, shikimate and dehydroshikimate transport protein
VGRTLASIFAGALSPLIVTGLMTAYRPETWPISVYMIILALITLVSVYYATETRVATGKT